MYRYCREPVCPLPWSMGKKSDTHSRTMAYPWRSPLLPRPPAWMSNTDQENQHDGIPPRLIFCGSIAITILSLGTCPALAQPPLSRGAAPRLKNSLPRLDNSPNLRNLRFRQCHPEPTGSFLFLAGDALLPERDSLAFPQGRGRFRWLCCCTVVIPAAIFVEETNPKPMALPCRHRNPVRPGSGLPGPGPDRSRIPDPGPQPQCRLRQRLWSDG